MTSPTSSKRGQTYLSKDEPGASFPLSRTVLLVIDPVNDFLSEGGAAWELTKSTVEMNDVVKNLRRAIEGARSRGLPVIFGPMAYTEEDYADEALHRRSGINRIMFEKKMFLAGSWGADFHPDLQPLGDEIVLLPHKGTDVLETDLPEHLQRLGCTHVVIAGMTANLCCESTGRHAAEAGYDVTYLKDAIGAESIPAYEASVLVNYPLVGNAVLKVDEFLAAIDSAAPSFVEVQAGDKVYGSDRGEIGSVRDVVPESAGAEAYMVITKGLVFEKETFIPLDAVVKRSGTDVFINVPKIVAGKMPWSEPPTNAGRREKLGPAAETVGKLYGSRSPTTQGKGVEHIL